MLGNQTFEYVEPFIFGRHLNHFLSEIFGERKTWFRVSAVLVYRKHINKFENSQTLVRKFARCL